MSLRNSRVWRAASQPVRAARRLRGSLRRPRPQVSVVLILYNIPREAPRTLFSLSAAYQRHIAAEDYEVIVIDNGSQPPVEPQLLAGLAGNFRLIRIDDASPSPVAAVNRGIAEARGDVIGVMIDGARIASPGLIHFARQGVGLYQRAVVAVIGWYLGHDFQRFAMQGGYDAAREDALLASIGWPQDGYRLFEIATMDESSVNGWLAPITESNGLFMSRGTWQQLGGMDARFDLPGGGLANLDTFRRAVELPGAELVLLLGEGTFHQLHGGVATNVPADALVDGWGKWGPQYLAIRGQHYEVPTLKNPPTYVGTLPRPALSHFVRGALHPVASVPAPLGPHFDTSLWANMPLPAPANPGAAPLIDLAQFEFRAGRHAAAAAVARLLRKRFPGEAEPQRLLSLVSGALTMDEPPENLRIEHHLALADAHRMLGDHDAATASYRAALAIDANLVRAHIGLATMSLPGTFYYDWLDRLYAALEPATIIEIGVAEGRSLAYARAPTLAIGVDPNPKAAFPLRAQTQIFAETSDDFFARGRPDALLGGKPLGIGFIDGLHLYEQALKDFINLERCCGPRSVILFHDTIPLDERTQRRACDTQFHTGDVWKVVPCLKHYRADLDVFTIATPWTGLTVVTGLDPASRVLSDRYEEAVARFIDTPFSEIENCKPAALNIVPNDWAVVEARLKARGVLA
jgi:Glycosyl transferase family 2/Methyltransferase domain